MHTSKVMTYGILLRDWIKWGDFSPHSLFEKDHFLRFDK
jgi:hypothetical protein